MNLDLREKLNTYGWLLAALLFGLVAAGSLTANSIFLHFDAPTQHAAAVDLLHGCWGFTSHKPLIMFLLAAPFALFGPDPVWELVLLSVLGMATASSVWTVLRRTTDSARWALIGALWFTSLPAVLYSLRIHIGYPLAFFTLGVVLHVRRRPLWAGFCFAAGSLSHGSLLLPVALWGLTTVAFDRETRQWPNLWRLAAGFIGLWLAVELVRFLYVGEPFGWFKGVVIGEMLRQNASKAAGGPTYLLRLLALANGWPNVALLLVGWLYPLLRRPRQPLLDAIAATGWGLIAFFAYRALRDQQVLARLYVAAYPLLVITAVVTARRGLRWLATRAVRFPIERWGAALASLAVALALIANTIGVAGVSVSGYRAAGEAVRRAAAEGLPVRWYGNYQAALFYARRDGAEMLAVNSSIDAGAVMGDTQAVLIFEYDKKNFAEVVAVLETEGWAEAGSYTITVVPHYPPSANRQSQGFLDAEQLDDLRSNLASNDKAHLAIWWPARRSGTFIPSLEGTAFYYPGTGCLSRPMYGGGTKHFYQILWENLLERLS